MNSVMRVDIMGGTVAALLLGGIGYFTIKPILTERRETAARALRLAEIDTQTAAAVDALRATTHALNASKAKAEELSVLPQAATNRNTKIAEVVAQAESFGLEIQTIQPGTESTGERYSRTPIDISLRGSIAAIARYLHETHEASSDLEITSLDIRAAGDKALVDAVIIADWITLKD